MTTPVQAPVALAPSPTSTSAGAVLLVDDDPAVLSILEHWLTQAGYDIQCFPEGESFLEALSQSIPEAICLDLNMPGLEGLDVLKRVKESHPLLPVIILTGDAEVDTVVTAMSAGAFDYLVKPADPTKLLATLRNAVEKYRLSLKVVQLEREAKGPGYSGIIGHSPPMKRLFRELDKICRTDIRALIQGESGTGKELVARALHENSGRGRGPFVAVNCAAIPESLQESELFGHEKGAFTGAVTMRRGRFEQANGGTLFLDEIGELTLPLQAKLLRALQERSFHRLGGSTEIHSDFRLVAATHRDLAETVRDGDFREDLYYRVAVYELRLPPLKERGEDILRLTQALVEELTAQGTEPARLSPETTQALMLYSWPGNVRELRNALERALVARNGIEIEVHDLPERILRFVREKGLEIEAPELSNESDEPTSVPAGAGSSHETTASAERVRSTPLSLEEMEREAIVDALTRTNRNIGAVVRELRISRTTLYRKMKRFGL